MSHLSRRHFLQSSMAFAAGSDTAWLGVRESAALIRSRKLSPVDLTKAALARIEKLAPGLNAYVTITAEQAMAQARELEAEQMRGRFRGPLHGVPIGLKDLYDTAGVRTTAASAHFATRVPDRDATVVTRLREAGAILTGKLNMDEFAFNFTSETSRFGPVQNPWKTGYTPGGSSGASAAAVAAGLCQGALGSDTGGSIRLPAALCGIVGFKPTYGALPADGVLPLSWSLDHVGPMTRTVEDAVAMMAAMGAPVRPSKPNWKTIRLGLPRAIYWEKLAPEVERAASAAVALLAKSTAGARDVALPPLAMDPGLGVLPQLYGTIIMAESYAYHEERVRRSPEKFHPLTLSNLRIGEATPVGVYARARMQMEVDRRAAASLFSDADLLLMPTAPGPAFPLGAKSDLIYLRNLAPWNYYGLPAISIPCGFTADGLPIGLQIVGPANSDALVLALADIYQRESGWLARRPPYTQER